MTPNARSAAFGSPDWSSCHAAMCSSTMDPATGPAGAVGKTKSGKCGAPGATGTVTGFLAHAARMTSAAAAITRRIDIRTAAAGADAVLRAALSILRLSRARTFLLPMEAIRETARQIRFDGDA